MDLALLSTRSFSFFPPYTELTLNNVSSTTIHCSEKGIFI
ncbi:hypothetical protein LEP1GSC021_1011 [Leptospira noguchii str. 1993005606]|uniref:Uncharacterized protein n=1 Tax=Leptospira noguchii str. 2007001578 TaxID=1049974 RepID=A0ABP2TB25_9LEPT|nr:hypothetical protein LEP1GSC035_4441 [Leptospira noguchii str. 2007001578]EPE84449.1 hypothetical protein LEP1GSC021_1011 [Leptospira noguchii str. 1993005606]